MPRAQPFISFILANVIVDAIFVPINVPLYFYNLAIIRCSFPASNLQAYCIQSLYLSAEIDARHPSQLAGAEKAAALLAASARLDKIGRAHV